MTENFPRFRSVMVSTNQIHSQSIQLFDICFLSDFAASFQISPRKQKQRLFEIFLSWLWSVSYRHYVIWVDCSYSQNWSAWQTMSTYRSLSWTIWSSICRSFIDWGWFRVDFRDAGMSLLKPAVPLTPLYALSWNSGNELAPNNQSHLPCYHRWFVCSS